MRLTVNGEAVPFSLENERTLGEVAAGLERWLAASGFVAVALSADGEDLGLAASERWRSRPLDGIAELGVAARHAGELRLEHWQATAGVLAALAGSLEAGAAADGAPAIDDELLTAAGEALAALRSGLSDPDAASAADRLERALAGATAADVRAWPGPRRAEAAAAACALADALRALAGRAAEPGPALDEAVRSLERLLPGLAEVAVQLQTGRDREAMATVTGLCDAVQRVLPLVPFLPRDTNREELVAGLNGALRGLLAAFEAKDTVLIGDLAEYEVAPRLAGLVPRLGRHP